MRLGAALPILAPNGNPIDGNGFAEGAALLERIGYASIWVFDAVGRGVIIPDPFMALSVAAATTTTVELGTGIFQLPLRNTVDTAYRALTLHHIAAGRFLFGVGPGSSRPDFDAFGVDYHRRFELFDGALGALRQLLRDGRHAGTDLTPWPTALGGPPLFIGAWRTGWVERAASEADGWIASAANNDLTTLGRALAQYREAGGQRAVVTNVQVGDLGHAIDRLGKLAELGFDDAVVLDMTPTEDRLWAICEQFGAGMAA